MLLKLREDWHIQRSWEDRLTVGSRQGGTRARFDSGQKCVWMYGTQDELTGESPYLGVLNAREDNWEAVAHAFFTKHKLESPWEKIC